MNKAIILGLNILFGLTLLSFSSDRPLLLEAVIDVNAIRNQKGNIIIQVYKDNTSYAHEAPFKQLTIKKAEINNGKMRIKFQIESGIYGFTLVDDENSNGKIDKNLIGMPKEGFGFSSYYMEKLKKPQFEQFRIDLNKSTIIPIRIKYM